MRLDIEAKNIQGIGYTPDWLTITYKNENNEQIELTLDVSGAIDYSSDGLDCRVKGELTPLMERNMETGMETELNGMSEEEIKEQYPTQRLWELIDKSSRFVVGLYPVYYRERDREEIFNAAMMDQFTSCYGVLEINVNGKIKAKAFEFIAELNFE